MTARGLIIAAPQSGAGKTTVTLALIAALRRRGIVVRAAKAGPDYIDPAFHAAATGAPSVNLDSWAMPPALLDSARGGGRRRRRRAGHRRRHGPVRRRRRRRPAAAARPPTSPRISVCRSSSSSTCRGQAQSAAALVRGFASHDPRVRVAGVILNRVGSERHRALVADAIAALGMPVLGAVPRERRARFARTPSRPGSGRRACRSRRLWFDRLAAMAERHFDLDALMRRSPRPPRSPPARETRAGAAAAGPAHRARARSGLHFRLSACRRRLARARARKSSVLAARRRAAAARLR